MSIWRNATIRLLVPLSLVMSTAIALAGDFPKGDPADLGFSAERLQRIDAWFQHRADGLDLSGKDAGDASGTVIAIARNGRLAYFQASGYQDRAKLIRMPRDAIFWIASMTKPVTSVAAMILVDNGKLELDAPVAKYLPELANMQVASEKASQRNGELALEPPKRAMTVRDLLRHTSGLVYPPQFLGSPVNQLYERATFRSYNTLEEFVHSLASLPLAHQPGEVWEYSWGVDVLARVVEVVSGQSFDKFLASRIFEPLHMVDTSFFVSADKLGRLVDPPEPREAQFDITRPRKLLSGGGGLASTAEDYLRFCQMLLNEGELDGARILKAESVRLMTADALPPGTRFALDFVGPSTGSSWGLGFAVRTSAQSSNIPGSAGSYTWNGVWGTWFWVDSAEKLVAVMMIQAVPTKSGPYRAAMRNLTYGALLVPRDPSSDRTDNTVSLTSEVLAEYAGKYDFGSSSSAKDRITAINNFAGIGAELAAVRGSVRVIRRYTGSPAALAGLKTDDLITEIDDTPTKGLSLGEVVDKLRGSVNSQVRVKIFRACSPQPNIDVVITRAPIYVASVELSVRADGGKLIAEATGPWPVLDFDTGKPVALAATSDHEFAVESGDRTRLSFVRDASGKVSGLVLNAGSPAELRGTKRPS